MATKTTADLANKIVSDARAAAAKYPQNAVAFWGSAVVKVERAMRKATEQSPELEAAWKECRANYVALV